MATMSAHDAATKAVTRTRAERSNMSSARVAGAVLDALQAAGYAVVPTSQLGRGCGCALAARFPAGVVS